uniref:Uncharacterized protein n=1 Tax=Arundo donax TaxID=35708 RepID=A0A0A9ECU3_ARUDO
MNSKLLQLSCTKSIICLVFFPTFYCAFFTF